MRIFIAVPSYWPSQDGVANITGYLAEGLAKSGHDILVFTSAGNGGLQKLPNKEEHNKVNIERMRIYVRWPLKLKGRDKESTPAFYRERLKNFAPDVLIVVCSQTWTLDWLFPYLDQISCPKIFYCHGYSKWLTKYDYGEKLRNRNILGVWELYLCKRYYDKLYKIISKFDLAVYLSEQSNAVAYAVKYQLTNGKILENAIDDAFFEPGFKHEYAGESQKEIKFLYVANFSQNKNQEMLIRAFARAAIGKSKLIFAAFEENEYSEYLQRYSRELLGSSKEKQVEFKIHLGREQVVDLYHQSDIFVCASKSETWSIVAHEAAAAAMPIISTDVGIYGNIDGALIVNNDEEMKTAFERLYHNYEDRKTRGQAAYRWLMTRQCRIQDKVEWLENEISRLTEGK